MTSVEIQDELLATAIGRIVDCLLPRSQCGSAVIDEHIPRRIPLGRIAGIAEDLDVLERQRLVGIADVDVEVGDPVNRAMNDLAVFLIRAKTGAGFTDGGEYQCGNGAVGDAADVHFYKGILDGGMASYPDPTGGVVAAKCGSFTAGVRAVVVPSADAAAQRAARFQCASKAFARTNIAVTRREHYVDEVSLDVMPTTQRLGLTDHAMAKAPLAGPFVLRVAEIHSGGSATGKSLGQHIAPIGLVGAGRGTICNRAPGPSRA